MAFNYSPKIATDGLVLYLDAANPRSYASGSTSWLDLSRGENNGSLVNGPTFNSANGGSIVFDGTNDYVDCGNPSILRPSTFTSISWIYNTDNSSRQQTIFSSYSELLVAGFAYQLWNSPQRIRYILGANTGGGAGLYADITGTTNINTNTWYQITITYDGTSMKSYVNGSIDLNSIFNSGVGYDTVNNKVIMGGIYSKTSGIVNFFKGSISNSILYNRALSAQEILQNYNALKGRYGL